MTKKKNSAMKKLIPATSMLLVSATMLTASTYAWFTMSREVEVKGINMTATVPEDLQISIGYTTATGSQNGDEAYNLNGNKSWLSGAGNENINVTAPSDTIAQHWSNTVEISHYYTLGKLIPASSTDGFNLFFTPDANNVGKTLKDNATFYQVTNGLDAKADTTVNSGTGTSLMATLYANSGTTNPTTVPTSGSSGTSLWSNYSAASAYNVTNDDGYYVDIPVWVRSSRNTPVQLKVSGYSVNYDNAKANNEANIELYKAVRCAIIQEGATASTRGSGTGGLINLHDGSGTGGYSSGASILDWYNDKGASTSGAVKSSGTWSSSTSGSIYGTSGIYDSNSAFITVPAKTTGEYGDKVKMWIRVWLEGEDQECWNENAGQDFSVSLKFEQVS